ncbi:efflux RND transporter permease subunit [Alkalimonas amylolytica]|uniref:SSD domain-containing protein n=1 Tax=Alkalimonas amylolytica TaxID=152573 RepID=A0A1H4AX64_ALKAM|nr:MMPL family transporter [Alkalimonas amylolytica]SEA40368.1 hypothetical protein SAMN04488051_10363 [Alkalimonas amylolytica]
MRDFLLRSVVYRPISTLLICLTIIIAVSWGAGLLVFKGDSRVFFKPDNPQLQAFDQMESVYAKSDNVAFLLVPKNRDIFTRENIELIHSLTDRSWQIPYVSRVDSLTNFQHSFASDDELIVGDLVRNPQLIDQPMLDQLRAISLREPLLVKRLISEQGHVSLINVTVQKQGVDPEQELADISQYARKLQQEFSQTYPDVDIHLTGLVMMDVAFIEAALYDNETLVPLMFIVVFLAIGLLLKTITGSIAALIIAISSIAVTLGATGWLGIYLTPPSAAAPIMILTIVVADCVHILSGMIHEMRQGKTRHQALYDSVSTNLKPIFLTSATTALGFLTMNFSDVPPFQDLGNMVAFGVMIAFVLSITLFPALLSLLPMKVSSQQNYQGSPLMTKMSHFVVAHHRRLLPGSVIVMACMLLFIPQNELNDKYVEFFDESVPFRAATELMEQELSGIDTLEFSIETGVTGGINNPQVIAAIADFSDWLRTLPEVDHVNTITDIFKRLNKNMHNDDPSWYKLPDNEELAAQYLLLYEMSLPMGLDLNNQVNLDKSATRLVVTLKNLSTYQLLELEEYVSDWFAEQYPDLELKSSSISLMFAHVSKKNIESMLFGSVIALILISPILGVALRSAKYGLISLLPNLLPAGIAFGIWGLLVGEVGLGLSVIIGTTLGIVVDDTVHFISKYLHARRERQMSPQDAVHYSFQRVGPALWITTFILIGGFLILGLSTYRVNAEMGIMTATTIAVALIIDFIFLPSLLIATDKAAVAAQPDEDIENNQLTPKEKLPC